MPQNLTTSQLAEPRLLRAQVSEALTERWAFPLLCEALSRSAGHVHRSQVAAALSQPNAIATLIGTAARERVLPSLHEAVAAHFAEVVPKWYRAVLATEHEANRRRNRLLRAAVVELAEAASRHGVEIAAIKGAAWLVEDPDRCAPWRTMLDIDLLVRAEDFDAMPQILASLGFTADTRPRRLLGIHKYRNHFHLVPYSRPDVPAFIEIHRHLAWRYRLLSVETIFATARRTADGIFLPAPWWRAFHAIVHWQVQNGGLVRASMPLKEILEVARLLERPDVDWHSVVEQARVSGTKRACQIALSSATEILGAPVPLGFQPPPEAILRVRRALACRTSPARTLLATDTWRATKLWRLDRTSYRLAINGIPPALIEVIVWLQRLVALPVLAIRVARIHIVHFARQLVRYAR